jgi:mono/diheme cytochrome c family protein
MKFRSTLFIAFFTLLLTACNMTLAQDVTPPPGAVQRAQAQPTQEPVFPMQAPNPKNGGVIYAEKCAACHGETGMGDGPQGEQLPVPVAALGLPETASKASPVDWYQAVTLGNIENFMPPFNSLSDQDRWDVVAYAFSLSTSAEQISRGEQIYRENCADCPTNFFTNQSMMAALTRDDLVDMLAGGGGGFPALGETLSQDELDAVAAYLRTLTLDASSLATEPASAGALEDPAQAESSSAEEIHSGDEGASAEIPAVGVGPVKGRLVNGSGGGIPSGVEVTLLGFEHALDDNSTPQEVINQTVKTDAEGAYLFEDVEIFENRIFLVETIYQGITFQSELAFSEAGTTELTIPDLAFYESTTDSGGLVVEQLHISFDMAGDDAVQVFELFTISNLSNSAVVFDTDGTSLPFMPLPDGATNVGLELSQDSAPLMPAETGFAIPPSEDFYSIIAFFNLPFDKSLEMNQQLAMPVSSALVIVPEGIKVKSDQLIDEGTQQTQQGFNIQMYSGGGLNSGSTLEMALSGKVKSAGSGAAVSNNRQSLLIGAGAFGVILILAGVWMYLRDRDTLEEDDFDDIEEEEELFETAEEVMDAIIALDDLYRAKKIPDEAYQARRAELKERLKELA